MSEAEAKEAIAPKPNAPNWPLVLLVIGHICLLLPAGLIFIMGILFASEVYRGDSLPFVEWANLVGPFILVSVSLIATIMLWLRQKHILSYAITALTFAAAFGYAFYMGM